MKGLLFLARGNYSYRFLRGYCKYRKVFTYSPSTFGRRKINKKPARIRHGFVFCIDVKRRTTPNTFKLWCPFRNAIFPYPCLPCEGYRNRANRGEEKEKFDYLTKNIMILIHNLCTNKKKCIFLTRLTSGVSLR